MRPLAASSPIRRRRSALLKPDSHNAERLARLQGEVQIIDGGDVAIRRFKGDAKIFHVQQQAAVTLLAALLPFQSWSWQLMAVFAGRGHHADHRR